MHRKDLPLVLLPRPHRKLIQSDIEELDGAIARRHDHLVLVRLGPGEIVERVLSLEPATPSADSSHVNLRMRSAAPFLNHDPIGRQSQDVKPSVPDEPKISRCGDCETGVEEWRVFDGVAIEALSAKLEHTGPRMLRWTEEKAEEAHGRSLSQVLIPTEAIIKIYLGGGFG